MKVYLSVLTRDYEGDEVQGVFSSPTKAEEYNHKQSFGPHESYEVEEYEVDELAQ